jgi:WD40 repeat protein
MTRQLRALNGLADGEVAFSRNGKLLASMSHISTVRIWSVETGAVLKTLRNRDAFVECVAFSPESRFLASGARDRKVLVSSVRTGALVRTLFGHRGWVLTVAFSLDGKLLASGSDDKTVRVWNAETGCCNRVLKQRVCAVWCIAFSPDNETLVSGSSDCTALWWNCNTGKCLRDSNQTGPVKNVAFSPDGETIALVAGYGGALHMCSAKSNFSPHHTEFVTSVAFSPDGKTLASLSGNVVRLWSVATGQCVGFFPCPGNQIAFSVNGKTLHSIVRFTGLFSLSLLNYSALCNALLLLHCGVAPYVLLDVANFLLAFSCFSAECEHMHREKIYFIEAAQKRNKR